ncbi:MAG: hypothetical protein J6L98_06930 [Bacteroidales bacterium]|nr:hypothetical protein [Bacteroidales bacterium]
MSALRPFEAIAASLAAMAFVFACSEVEDGPAKNRAKTTFQTSSIWKPTIDTRADATMVYGTGKSLEEDGPEGKSAVENRIRSWKERGYQVDFMTGIAWGGYADYFTGKWDGIPHLDEGQKQADGDTIWHGKMVPYIVPSENYLNYFKESQVKRVIDAGVEALYFEEPEFWNRGGYSEAFKREWESYYGEAWRPQDESPEATYLSNKLKYHLYYRALDEVTSFAKKYGRSKGLDIKCYVPTHSLINYSQWEIVSPEASLASMPGIDGYIAQVWTGTSRVPNYFNGILRERTFETAFLEYGCMASKTAPTGRRVWFLTDPIEDGTRDWEDYRRNYHATFTAQLLHPRIADFEIMPWPQRIYEKLYPKSAGSDEMIRIPADYATMMQVMVGSLGKIPASEEAVSGSEGISVLMGNSLMFQRFPTHDGYEDPALSDFFGMAMPLLKSGIPVGITHIENVGYEDALKNVKVLVMTYSNMKPMEPEAHNHIAEWVKDGGRLIYASRDTDPFQSVKEWWNTGEYSFKAPSDHLFSLMGIESGAPEGNYPYGKGSVLVIRKDPKEFVMTPGSDGQLMDYVEEMYSLAGNKLLKKNNFRLSRGPYELVAVLSESVSEEPLHLEGRLIDLFDPQLPVVTRTDIHPGQQRYFYNLDKAPKAPAVLASADRVYDAEKKGRRFSYLSKGPSETICNGRVLLPGKPVSVLIDDTETFDPARWDEVGKTYLVSFPNNPDGVRVEFRW